jgi:hypothetical protein
VKEMDSGSIEALMKKAEWNTEHDGLPTAIEITFDRSPFKPATLSCMQAPRGPCNSDSASCTRVRMDWLAMDWLAERQWRHIPDFHLCFWSSALNGLVSPGLATSP